MVPRAPWWPLLAALSLSWSPLAGAATQTFSNALPISIPNSGSASPYPSSISVTGMTGTITSVRVTITGLNHQELDDVDILLRGPVSTSSRSVMLVSDAGGVSAGTYTLTFQDGSPAVPDTFMTSDTYGPTNWEASDPNGFPFPATHTTFASAYDCLSPNGTWSLYVYDDSNPRSGDIFSGWSITITTLDTNQAPVLSTAGDPFLTAINEDTVTTGTLVSGMLATAGDPITDLDACSVEGIAITFADTANGFWQYATTGANWVNFPAVSATSALLLFSDTVTRIRFRPAANWNGTKNPAIGFRAWDRFNGLANGSTANPGTGGGTSPFSIDTETARITVNPVNDAPVAVNDSRTTPEDTPLTVAAPGVLANDTDVEGSPLSAVLGTGPANGTLTLNANGSFTYTPNANFAGADSFTYRASDGLLTSALATVTLTVTAVNDPPTAVNDARTTPEDTPINEAAPGVLGNDVDIDSTLSAVLVTGPTNGTLTLNSNGSFLYTPNANFFGTDFFTYNATDGAFTSGPATVSITITSVNDAPIAGNNAYSTAEDTPLTIAAPGVLSNDSDVEGSSLSAVLGTGPANGTLTLNASGSFTYTPSANFFGTDSFTYRASDGLLTSALATVTLTVTAVNDPPTVVNDSRTTPEDTPLNVAAPGVLGNDTDDGPMTAVLVTGPTRGTLTLNANGSFLYTPNANVNGTDSFTYNATDGTFTSGPATVTITITAVNDAPNAAGNSYATAEDTPLTVAAPGVLGNDTDVEGSALSAVLGVGPANGTLTLNANGSFTYTPNANFAGADSFTYRASDGALTSALATVNLTVTAVNDAPVGAADSATTNEDVVLNVAAPGVLGNDSDVDSAMTAVLVTGPTRGSLTLNADGSYRYTPSPNLNGTDSFTYRASDGALTSAVTTVTITVNAVNDAPVAVADARTTSEDTPLTIGAPGVMANDTDVEGSALTAALGTGPTRGTVNLASTGAFTYTPNANISGTDSFTYVISDGALTSAPATVTITITAVNDPPAAAADFHAITAGNTLTVPAPGVLSNDTDVETATLTAVPRTTTANGMLTLNANGSFSYTPNAGFTGTDTFTYSASDGTDTSVPATVSITVSIGGAPIASPQSATVTQGSSLPIVLSGSDPDGNPLTFTVTSQPASGTLTGTPPNLTYTPGPGFRGQVTFTFTASDGVNISNPATVTITVENAPPVVSATADRIQPLEGDVVQFSATAADPGGDALSYTWDLGDGTTSTQTAPVHIYADEGLKTARLTVSDGLTSSSATVTLDVQNAAPVLMPGPGEVRGDEGSPLTFVAGATDPGSADLLSYLWTFGDGTSDTSGGTVTHVYPDDGSYPVQLTVDDGDGASVMGSLTAVVANVPPIPEAVTQQEAPLGLELRVDLRATDPGGTADPLTWTLRSGPGALAADGVFTWTPDVEGMQVVTARVTDDEGAGTDLNFEINATRLELTGGGCGCGAGGTTGPSALAAAGLLAWLRGRRRRGGRARAG